jgi:hypothetical protein
MNVGFGVDRVALGKFFSKHFGFSIPVTILSLLHTPVISGAAAIGSFASQYHGSLTAFQQ